jgi:hypothetical protein
MALWLLSAMVTPYDEFILLTNPKQYLKPDITLKPRNAIGKKMNNNETAEQLNSVRDTLF